MMKSPSTTAWACPPLNAAQVINPIEPPTLTPCIVPSRPIVTFTTPCWACDLWPTTSSIMPGSTSSSCGPISLKAFAGLGVFGPDCFHRVPDRLDPCRELLRLALAADVHEVDLRLVEEEVIVQARH